MIRKFIVGISLSLTICSAMIIASVGEVDNWWVLVKPWFTVFVISAVVGIISYNLTEIRRYTYPTLVCVLAWANEHHLARSNFAKQSNFIYRKHNRSYSKLYEITQYLYDRVMLAEV